MRINEVRNKIVNHSARSAWEKGVREYALWLLDKYIEKYNFPNCASAEEVTERGLMNGASSWESFSWGGGALICNIDICERLCTPSEQRKYNNGELKPAAEEWFDVQARALGQAAQLIIRIASMRE